MNNPPRRVTNEQNTGAIGESQFAQHLIKFGWQPRGLTPDLGEDFIVDIYDEGVSAGLAFFAQLKSTSDLSSYKLKKGDYSYKIKVKDLQHWCDYTPSVILVIWDIEKLHGHWIMASDAIKRLEDKISQWETKEEVKVHIPNDNLLDHNGLKQLRQAVAGAMWPTIREGKTLEMELKFSFSNDAEGQAQSQAIREHLAQGTSVAINGRFLTDIRLSDWYERKFGKPTIQPQGQLVLGPTHSNTVEQLSLTLISPQNRVVATQVVEVKAVLAGEEQVTFANSHSPTPFSFRLTARKDGYTSSTLSLDNVRSTGKEAFEAYEFFRLARESSKLRVAALSNAESWSGWRKFELPLDPNDLPELDNEYGIMLERLALIEKKTGVTFSLTHYGISQRDSKDIEYAAQVLETGRIEADVPRETQTLSGPSEADAGRRVAQALIAAYERGERVSFNGEVADIQPEIMGVRIPLGPMRMHANGDLEPECARELQELLDTEDSPQQIMLRMANVHRIEEFSDWLNTPPQIEPTSEED